MNEQLTQLLDIQFPKLPKTIQDLFLSGKVSTVVAELGGTLGFTQDQSDDLGLEVLLLISGLSDPKEFPQTLKERLNLNEVTLGTLIDSLEEKILESIYPDLVRFYEQDQARMAKAEAEENAREATPAPATPEPVVVKIWEKTPEIVPDNLPTDESIPAGILPEESFIPALTPKPTPEAPTPALEPAHPFEEKMQKVFTAGAPAMENFELENTVEEKPKPVIVTARPVSHDPYREPIE